MRCNWIILAGILLLPAARSDQGLGSEAPRNLSLKASEGFASPVEAWRASIKAAGDEDWKSLYDCLTPAARDEATFNALLGLIMSVEWHHLREMDDRKIRALVAESDALLKLHGINQKQIEKESEKAEEAGLDRLDLQKMCLRRLSDKRRFFGESTALSIKIRKAFFAKVSESPDTETKPEPDAAARPEPGAGTPPNLGKLVDVKIRGDRATGKVTERLPESTTIINAGKRIRFVTKITYFRRIDGRWYLASESGEPIKAPLHRIAQADVPFEKKLVMEAGDAFQFELPNGKIVAVWCGAAKNFMAAEQATSSGLKTSWGEQPFKHVRYKRVPRPDGGHVLGEADSYIKQGPVVTSGADATSTYKLFVGQWEFDIVEDLKAKNSLPVTIRVVKRKDE